MYSPCCIYGTFILHINIISYFDLYSTIYLITASEQTGSLTATPFSPALSLGQSGAGGTVDAAVLSNDAGSGMPGESSAGLLSMLDNVSEAVRGNVFETSKILS